MKLIGQKFENSVGIFRVEKIQDGVCYCRKEEVSSFASYRLDDVAKKLGVFPPQKDLLLNLPAGLVGFHWMQEISLPFEEAPVLKIERVEGSFGLETERGYGIVYPNNDDDRGAISGAQDVIEALWRQAESLCLGKVIRVYTNAHYLLSQGFVQEPVRWTEWEKAVLSRH